MYYIELKGERAVWDKIIILPLHKGAQRIPTVPSIALSVKNIKGFTSQNYIFLKIFFERMK